MVLNWRQARGLLPGTVDKRSSSRGIAQMAEPIANDWKAIHDRMQQIRAEQSAFPMLPTVQRPGLDALLLGPSASPSGWLCHLRALL